MNFEPPYIGAKNEVNIHCSERVRQAEESGEMQGTCPNLAYACTDV